MPNKPTTNYVDSRTDAEREADSKIEVTTLTKEYDDFFGKLHDSPFKNVPKSKRKRLILKFVRLMMDKFNK